MRGSAVTKTRYVRGRFASMMTGLGIAVYMVGWVMGFTRSGPPLASMAISFTGWLIAAGGYAFFGAFERLALVRMIQDLPTARIRSAQQGYVELHGTARSIGRPVRCPRCDLYCLWYVYYVNKGKQRVTPGADAPDFLLEDSTGRVRVKAHGAEVLSARRKESGGHVHICAGDPIYALGEFHTRTPPAVDPRLEAQTARTQREESVRRKLLSFKYDARRMAMFDTNRDGKLDEREQQAMAKVAEAQAARESAAAPAPPPSPPDSVLIAPQTEADRLPFVLVVGTERDAVSATRLGMLQRCALAVGVGLFGFLFMTVSYEREAQREARRQARAEQAQVREAKATAPAASRREPRPTSPALAAHNLGKAGRYEEAVAAYDELIAQEPHNGDHYARRAFAHHKLGNAEQASADAQSACELGEQRGCEMAERLAPSP